MNTGLYIHIPFCRTKCRYCGFYSECIDNYNSKKVIDAILVEMQRRKSTGTVGTIYIGGGSPSCLTEDDLLQLANEAVKQYPSIEEFTIEANPGQVDSLLLTELQSAGVTRLSIGAQSFNKNELEILGRAHDVNCISRAVDEARQAGFENISLDLIFAIPGSDLSSYEQNLDCAIELDVQHISSYALTYEKNTPFIKALIEGRIEPVDEEIDRAMYEMTIDTLTKAGFEQYEISNFAKRGFECKHNLNYWSNDQYIGIGPGASSYLNHVRSHNIADIDKYTQAIANNEIIIADSETLTDIERACETAILNLRRISGINLPQFKVQTRYDAEQLFAEPIEKYIEASLLAKRDDHIFLTRTALPIADSVLCDFAGV